MRRNRTAIYAVTLILFFLEITVFRGLRIYWVRPELLLIAVIFFWFYFGMAAGAEIGAISGALKDMFTISAFGINTFSFLAIGFFAGLLKDKIFKESVIVQFICSGAAAYLISGIYFLYLNETLKCPLSENFWTQAFSKILYTGLAAPLLFLILGKSFKPETTEETCA